MLLVAAVIILIPSLLDFEPIDNLTRGAVHTRDAVIGLVGVFVTARIVDTWSRLRTEDRDRNRFRGISTIAFRSLSQTVNDVGRILLAPLVGADLHSAGIPGFSQADHDLNVRLLKSREIEPQAGLAGGFWSDLDDVQLRTNLLVLCADAEFVTLMFRASSTARRRLQDAMADWAPVMVTVPAANDQLGPGWRLADQLVLLAESWRALGIGLFNDPVAPDPVAIERVERHYFEAVSQYRTWLDALQPHARLPTRGYAASPKHPVNVTGKAEQSNRER